MDLEWDCGLMPLPTREDEITAVIRDSAVGAR